jgi:hypothetical protein
MMRPRELVSSQSTGAPSPVGHFRPLERSDRPHPKKIGRTSSHIPCARTPRSRPSQTVKPLSHRQQRPRARPPRRETSKRRPPTGRANNSPPTALAAKRRNAVRQQHGTGVSVAFPPKRDSYLLRDGQGAPGCRGCLSTWLPNCLQPPPRPYRTASVHDPRRANLPEAMPCRTARSDPQPPLRVALCTNRGDR